MIAIRKSMILPILAVMLIIYLQTAQGISRSSEEDSSESSSASSSSSSSSDSDSSSSETKESSESSSVTEESNENKKQNVKRFVPERFRRQPYPSEKLEEFQYDPPKLELNEGGIEGYVAMNPSPSDILALVQEGQVYSSDYTYV
ncbi:uncharacterized protein LOC122503711 [Leptopilina heterotoma]|uniref:uncharacterized protein LOC122503711 n=1 Tax=Leptopilina heterotoma TaxID=63436 RepID=UPI001CA7F53B|nr:uncharacterized protein LOC122503711 [Leptopilina heterotoma]